MAQLKVSIPHVAWRDGRPRFVPGPKLRVLGFKGEDLREAGGAWMSAEAALVFMRGKEVEIAERRRQAAAAVAAGRRLRPIAKGRAAVLSLDDLFEQWFTTDPRMKGVPIRVGRREIKPLSPASVRSYRGFRRVFEQFDPVLLAAPAEALSKPICYDLYERLWEARGLATARGVIAMASAAMSWGMKKGKVRYVVNPFSKLGMEMAPPRLRCGTPEEMRVLVAAADAFGRPEIGDAIVLGLWTGQRQADRLALVDAGLVDGRRIFRQSKTRAIVAIAPAPMLEQRLEAARRRRADWPVQPLELVVDERARQPFKHDWYRHVFKDVRDDAAKRLPSLADFTDQDLRDTAVTWLARAGCTLPEICAITGHEPASAAQILKHYLASHPELADNAIAKLVAWYEGQA